MRHDYIGQQIGPYLILEILAHGVYTTVYRARDMRYGAMVALKVLNLASPQGADHARRFAQEMGIAVTLRHEHIVPVIDHGEAGVYRYFVMELMRNGTLKKFLDLRREENFPIPVKMALVVGIQLCEALHFAHQHSVIHRDVKPANIFLGNENALHLKLGDFGIALLLERLERLTGTGKTVGTPEYMAPEQIQGGPIDGRADEYAIASVLYEMLSLRPPYSGPSAMSIAYTKLQEPPIPLQQLNNNVPAEVAEVIHQALNPYPDDRFFSTEVFARALANCM